MWNRPDRRPSWPQFAAWACCGAGAGLVLVGAFTIGLLALPAALVFAGVAVFLGGANISALGVVAGPAAWAFLLAWLNRQGPGSVCVTSATSTSCADEWSPWPFLVVGLVLLVAPVLAFARARRRDTLLRSA